MSRAASQSALRIGLILIVAASLAAAAAPASATYRGLARQVTVDTGVDMRLMTDEGSVQHSYGLNATPQEWSPDGVRLLYNRDGYVWSMRADGRDKRRLARGTGGSWSPDGTWVVFQRKVGSGRRDVDVFKMRRDGSGVRRLTWTTGDAAGSFGPRWNPSGGTIAYIRDKGSYSQIFVMRTDGTADRQVSDFQWWLEGTRARSLDWSPDGLQLATDVDAPRCGRNAGMNPNGRVNVYRLSVRTGVRDAIRGDCTNLHGPTWSPDGRRIMMHVDYDTAYAPRHYAEQGVATHAVDDQYDHWPLIYVRKGSDFGRAIWRPLR